MVEVEKFINGKGLVDSPNIWELIKAERQKKDLMDFAIEYADEMRASIQLIEEELWLLSREDDFE